MFRRWVENGRDGFRNSARPWCCLRSMRRTSFSASTSWMLIALVISPMRRAVALAFEFSENLWKLLNTHCLQHILLRMRLRMRLFHDRFGLTQTRNTIISHMYLMRHVFWEHLRTIFGSRPQSEKLRLLDSVRWSQMACRFFTTTKGSYLRPRGFTHVLGPLIPIFTTRQLHNNFIKCHTVDISRSVSVS